MACKTSSHQPTFPLVLFALAPLLIAGCQNQRVVHEEAMIPPTHDMSKMKGNGMPPEQSAPMPTGWKGFKPY